MRGDRISGAQHLEIANWEPHLNPTAGEIAPFLVQRCGQSQTRARQKGRSRKEQRVFFEVIAPVMLLFLRSAPKKGADRSVSGDSS